MEFLTKDAIEKAPDLQSEPVEVPEWNGTVLVRGLTAADKDKLMQAASIDAPPGKRDADGNPIEKEVDISVYRLQVVARSLVDQSGTRLFGDDEIHLLGAKDSEAVERIFRVAQRLSKLRREDVEGYVKNSESSQS